MSTMVSRPHLARSLISRRRLNGSITYSNAASSSSGRRWNSSGGVRGGIYSGKELSSVYQQLRPAYDEKWTDQVLHGMGETNEASVLDVGAGSLQGSLALAPRVARVVAVDRNAEMLLSSGDEARPDNVEVRVGSAEALPFPEGAADGDEEEQQCVDLVLAAQCFHWFDRRKFIAELQRVLRPGGRFVATVYGPAMLFDDERATAVARELWERTRDAEPWSAEMVSHYADVKLDPETFCERRVFKRELERRLSFRGVMQFISTWALLNSHIVATGEDKEAILEEVEGQLAEILGADATDVRVRWPSSIITWKKIK